MLCQQITSNIYLQPELLRPQISIVWFVMVRLSTMDRLSGSRSAPTYAKVSAIVAKWQTAAARHEIEYELLYVRIRTED